MPGVIAVLFGSMALIVVFVPLVALSYRRRGGFSALRMIGWVALLFYVMGLWAYTLLPMPDGDDFRCVGVVLNPLEDVVDIARLQAEHGGSLLANAAVQQLALNVLLFLPLGFFVRALFDRGIAVAIGAGALVSLAIELTQLTGVWGVFHCAYRVFDTGDLLSNTVGAVLGSLAALLVVRRGRGDGSATDARPITTARRLLAMLVDLATVWLTSAGLSVLVNTAILVLAGDEAALEVSDAVATGATLVAIGAQAVSVMAGGITLGERAVLIDAREQRAPRWLWRVVRFLAGIGGYSLLALGDSGGPAAVLALVSLVAAFTTRGHRGLAQAVAGMDAVDRNAAREPETVGGSDPVSTSR
ncbi:RDD family protein [Agromyces cerinus subsp. cerinus]|uniref:RDD family protein n=2 Tax=Agromyces cerinus TaxID=33878 RepID=A0A1N6DFR1_9MICO|nr:RDD family protein [Agromyces cerinus subsp. cerinus]